MKTKTIIIALILFWVGILTGAAILNPAKPEPQSKNFSGVDAAGFKHYPNGHLERIDIKIK